MFTAMATVSAAAVLVGAVLLLIVVVARAAGDPQIIGPQDSQLALQASVTKTASFNSTGIDLGAGFAPAGGGLPMQAIVNYSAGDFTTGDETYTFKLQECATLGGTYTDCSAGVAAPVTVAAPAGAITIGANVRLEFVRLVCTIAGTTPTITYSAYLQPQTVKG